eukprot:359236-Chlamydomonas_euryale.AAC.12
MMPTAAICNWLAALHGSKGLGKCKPLSAHGCCPMASAAPTHCSATADNSLCMHTTWDAPICHSS